MSTHMTEDDWAVALEVFEANLPRRDAKGRDNRLFLEAVHYFSSITSPGGLCPPSSASGILSGNDLTD